MLIQLKFTLKLEYDAKLTVAPESGVSPGAAMKHKTDTKQNIRQNFFKLQQGFQCLAVTYDYLVQCTFRGKIPEGKNTGKRGEKLTEK